jgi:hypothetical protein
VVPVLCVYFSSAEIWGGGIGGGIGGLEVHRGVSGSDATASLRKRVGWVGGIGVEFDAAKAVLRKKEGK